MLNPRSLRWTAIAEDLAKKGLTVHVVCSKVSGEKESETINGVVIHRVGFRSQANQRLKSKSVTAKKYSLLKKIYNSTVKHLVWPDSNAFWINPAKKKCVELLHNFGMSNLITVSHPFSGHIVGLKVKKRFSSLNWICDIGDPFAFLEFANINNKKIFNWYNYKKERDVLAKSNWQSVTTELTKKEYIRKKMTDGQSMEIMPPLLRYGAVQQVPANQSKHSFVDWVFVGTLYKKIRSPDYLLDLFVKVNSIGGKNHKLHFYGETKMCEDSFNKYKNEIGKTIFLHGLVSPEQAREATVQADVLVNIGNKTSYQLPSKLVEYMAMGKAILNVKSIDNDSSEAFLSHYPFVINIEEKSSLDKSSELFLSEYCNLNFDNINTSQYISDYLIGPISEKYLSLLN